MSNLDQPAFDSKPPVAKLPILSKLPEPLCTGGYFTTWSYVLTKRKPGAVKPPKWRKVPDPAVGHGMLSFDAAWKSATARQPNTGVGLFCGHGVTVIDFDKVRDPVTGEIDDEVADDVAALASVTYVEMSPSGKGFHAYVLGNYPTVGMKEGARVERLGEGKFSTLSGVKLPGSQSTLGEAPVGMMERLFPIDAEKPRREQKPVASDEPPPSLDELREMLRFVQAADEAEYFRITVAIRDTYGEAARDIWDEWSRESAGGNYDPDENDQKWNRPRSGGKPATIATVIWRARKAGYGATSAEEDFGGEGAGNGRPPPSTLPLATRYIFVKGQDRYFDRESRRDFSRSAIDAGHRAEQIAGLHLTEKKKAPKASHYVDVNCEMVDDFVWYPGRPLVTEFQGVRCVNTFRAPEPISVVTSGGRDLWDAHVEYLIPDAAQRKHFLDVMAFGVQFPDRKVNHAVVLYEPTGGTGKDVMLQPFRRWLHGGGWVETNLDALGSQFQHYLDGAKFLCVQEARDMEYGKSHHLYNQMKNVIAAPPDWLTVNKKNRQPYDVPNVVQVIFQTNYENGVYYENVNDRRYFVAECATVPKDAEYYSRLVDFIDAEWRVIIGKLLGRDLSAFRPGAAPPQTEMKARMHKATRPLRDAELDLLLEKQGEMPFTLEELRAQGFGCSAQTLALLASPTGLGRELEKRGYQSTRQRVPAGLPAGGKAAPGDRLRLWFRGEYSAEQALQMYLFGVGEA